MPGTSPPDRPPTTEPRSGPLVLGVLGGIASGKSRVAALLAGPGGRVLDADRIAREILAGDEVRGLIRDHFGAGVFGADGELDRAALGRTGLLGPGGAPAPRKLDPPPSS